MCQFSKVKALYGLIRNTFQLKHPYRIETSKPIHLANQLTGSVAID